MKKWFLMLAFCLSIILMGVSTSSCNRKSGCAINDNATVSTNRKGKLPKKGGKSQLFPKKMRRKN